jgi:hypothetical protein
VRRGLILLANSLAPEALEILAGGEATGIAPSLNRALKGRRTNPDLPIRASPGSLPGREKISFDLSRWLRCAPPPANFHRPSEAQNNFAEFASSIRTRPHSTRFNFQTLAVHPRIGYAHSFPNGSGIIMTN